MFDIYINEKISEKINYDMNLFLDYLTIYIKSILYFYNNKENRNNLTKFLKQYYIYTKKEYELLIRIKELNCKFEHDNDVIKILDELEQLFVYNYNDIENILLGYEDSFKYRCILYSNFKSKGFNIKYLDDSIERIKGMER